MIGINNAKHMPINLLESCEFSIGTEMGYLNPLIPLCPRAQKVFFICEVLARPTSKSVDRGLGDRHLN